MVQVASLFNQLLHHFPRLKFAALVNKHRAERAAKGFECWTQFVAMLFCQLGHAEWLREICNGLSCCLGKLSHLGVKTAPKKSTLSYANQHRPAALFQDLFYTALSRFRQQQGLGPRRHTFHFRNKLLSLDSTTISLCLKMFPWALCRHNKGGVKAHVLLDHDDYLPRYVLITPGRTCDVRMAYQFTLPKGSIVAVDRGYVDFQLFTQWTEAGVYFVTRPLHHMVFQVEQSRPVPANSSLRSDQTVRFTSEWAQRHGFKIPLRRIVVWNETKQQEIVLLTNHFDFDASTLADIYKERWQIELFFKALKQNLKIRSFVGTTENALHIQIWTALIAMLLLKWLHHLSQANWSLSNLATMLRLNLFTYRDLIQWLHHPFSTPPLQPHAPQLQLALG
jgi:Transposase DDE domain/Domain of unknown function (DUF4372)